MKSDPVDFGCRIPRVHSFGGGTHLGLLIAAVVLFNTAAFGQAAGDLDSLVCVVGARTLGRALGAVGLGADSIRVLLPPEVKKHWTDFPVLTTQGAIVVLEELHGRVAISEIADSSGWLYVEGIALFVPPKGDSTRRILLRDSILLWFGGGSGTEDALSRKYDLVNVTRISPQGPWERFIEPGLVIIGGAAIIALFFLIRS